MKGKFLLLANLPWILLSFLNYFFFHSEQHQLISILMWYYQWVFIGILMFPMVSTLLPRLPDKGYALSKIISIILLFYLNWILTNIGILSFSGPSLSFCLITLLALSHIIPHKEADLFKLLKDKFRYIWKAELIYLFVFSLLLVIQSRHPDIFWGEKPMDYTLLNFNLRNTELPLQDPWFAGETMHYYYLGYYIFAGMAKMTGVGGELGYALSIVTCGALFCVTLFGLLVYLTKRAMTSLWGVFLIVFASNFRAFSAFFFEKEKVDFKFFWSTTRVFGRGGFAEYPSWSLLFADLHPHVMSYPFAMLYLLLLIYCVEHLWSHPCSCETLYGGGLLALSFGALLGINGWDFIIYALFSCIYFVVSLRNLKVIRSALFHSLFHGISLLLFLPMLITLRSGKIVEWGRYRGITNKIFSHFSFHGHWWIIIFCMVFPVIFLHRKGIKWNVLYKSIGFRFTISGFIIALCAEFFFFSDRLNTIFKVFTNVYIWGGIACVISFRFFKFYLTKRHLIPFALICIFVMNIVLFGSYYNYKGVTNKQYFRGTQKGLRGGLYMNQYNPRDYKIISWINENVEGIPTLVERYSKSFDTKAARISMHTGLPTYLGWEGHVYLRGAPWREIEKRKREIDYIFNGADPIATVNLLTKKNISFIVVGNLERSFYSKVGIEKFSKNSDIFKLLYKNGESALYGVGEYQKFISKR